MKQGETVVSIELQPVSVPKPSTTTSSTSSHPTMTPQQQKINSQKGHRRSISLNNIGEFFSGGDLKPNETCCNNYWCKAKRSYALDFSNFIIFLVVLGMYASSYRNGTQGFYLTSSIEDTIFAQEMPFGESHIQKTFRDVEDEDELWSYYNQVLIPALYTDSCDLTDGECLPHINGLNYVIAPPRIFQNRMETVPCVIPNHIDKAFSLELNKRLKSKPCYPEYVDGSPSTEYRFNKTTVESSLSECFEYKSRKVGYPIVGDINPSSYDTSGYECRIPKDMNLTQVLEFFKNLQDSNWVDDATRLISIDFTIFNPSVSLFAVVRVVFEKSSFGIFVPWRDIVILDMDRDLKADYISDLVTQIFLGLFVTMFIAQLVTEYIADGKKCCCDPWNIFEAINMFFFVFYFFFTMLGGIMLNHELTTSNVDYTDVAFFYELAEWILTVNMILSVCVVFKHLRVSKRMSLLLVTFKKAGKSLCSMLLVTMIFVLGFTLSLYIGFGHRVHGLSSITKTFSTLIFSIFGDFPYVEEIREANRFLGPGILIVYFIFMDLILVSMLIAVIEEAFSQAQEDLRAHREDDKLLQSFQSQVKSFKKFGGKLSNLGHMVRSRSVSKFKRGSGKSTEITNPAAALPRKMSFGSLIAMTKIKGDRAKKKVVMQKAQAKKKNAQGQNGSQGSGQGEGKKKYQTGRPSNLSVDLTDSEVVHFDEEEEVKEGEKLFNKDVKIKLNELKREAEIERNIQGLSSKSARTRRKSHAALLHASVFSNKSNNGDSGSGGGAVSEAAMQQLNQRLKVMEKKLSRISQIEAKLDKLILSNTRSANQTRDPTGDPTRKKQQSPVKTDRKKMPGMNKKTGNSGTFSKAGVGSRRRRVTESAAEHTRVETVLPVEWEKSFSEEECRNYYYNRKSGVTQWELPEGGQKGGSLIKM